MKPFKACLRRQWAEFVVKSVKETGTPRRPPYDVLSERISKAVSAVTEKSIISWWTKSGLIQADEHFETPPTDDFFASHLDEIGALEEAFATLTSKDASKIIDHRLHFHCPVY